LLNKTLVEDGLSSVRALLDSGHDFSTDSSKIDEVLGQMEIRLEMAKVLGQFVSNENVTHTSLLILERMFRYHRF
jgi:hypothetical protein